MGISPGGKELGQKSKVKSQVPKFKSNQVKSQGRRSKLPKFQQNSDKVLFALVSAVFDINSILKKISFPANIGAVHLAKSKICQ